MTLFTEKEAAAKWCPLTFNSESFEMCSGSKCMAWRIENAMAQGQFVPRQQLMWISAGRTYACEPTRPAWMTDEWRWDERRGVWLIGDVASERGYCGAFGKVEP